MNFLSKIVAIASATCILVVSGGAQTNTNIATYHLITSAELSNYVSGVLATNTFSTTNLVTNLNGFATNLKVNGLAVGGNVTLTNSITTYNGTATAGNGVPAIYSAVSVSSTFTASWTGIIGLPSAGLYQFNLSLQTFTPGGAGNITFGTLAQDNAGFYSNFWAVDGSIKSRTNITQILYLTNSSALQYSITNSSAGATYNFFYTVSKLQ